MSGLLQYKVSFRRSCSLTPCSCRGLALRTSFVLHFIPQKDVMTSGIPKKILLGPYCSCPQKSAMVSLRELLSCQSGHKPLPIYFGSKSKKTLTKSSHLAMRTHNYRPQSAHLEGRLRVMVWSWYAFQDAQCSIQRLDSNIPSSWASIMI